jgi:glycosyltransferase involved in cell wall biosynthesis
MEDISDDKSLFEVIVADNGSTDKSIDIAKKYGASIIEKPDATIAELRNCGASIARGMLYVFIDADCTFPNNWLPLLDKYIHSESVGIFGSIPKCPHDGTWVEKVWQAKTEKGIFKTSFICTANMIVKKDVFWEVGGFDTRLVSGEDYDLCQRVLLAGYEIVNDDSLAVVHWRYPKTLLARFRKELWYGRNTFDILKIKPLYRPFWASVLFGSSSVCSVVALLVGKPFYALVFVSISLVTILISVFFKLIKSKQYKYFPQLFVLFAVYLSGRFCAVVVASLTLCKNAAIAAQQKFQRI